MPNDRRQGKYWLLTIPANDWSPVLHEKIAYLRGQKELGGTTGYEHWQLLAITQTKASIHQLKQWFTNSTHAELSRSSAATQYVWKEATRIHGTQFELGQQPIKRNSKVDWEKVWELAKDAKIDEIPAGIRVCHYRTIQAISSRYSQPLAMERSIYVYWGPTGAGKSRDAWLRAGLDAYPKDPRSKFWDGYRGQERVVIDEFRGGIDISHLLRWFDRYPVLVEIKGSSTVLNAKEIYVTSNLSPDQWYPDLDIDTKNALLRRLSIKEY